MSKQSYEEELALFRRYGAALKRRATEMGDGFAGRTFDSKKLRKFHGFFRDPIEKTSKKAQKTIFERQNCSALCNQA